MRIPRLHLTHAATAERWCLALPRLPLITVLYIASITKAASSSLRRDLARRMNLSSCCCTDRPGSLLEHGSDRSDISNSNIALVLPHIADTVSSAHVVPLTRQWRCKPW
jgi:hypothetical protein